MAMAMHKAQNENRPGYKKTNIGWIPKEWAVLPLGKLGEFSKGSGIAKTETVEKGLYAIRYGELYTNYDICIDEINTYITEAVARQAKRVCMGDILFAGSGETLDEIGKCAALKVDEKVYAGGDIIVFTPNADINSVFLSYILNSNWILQYKRRLGQGHSVVHMYADTLKNLCVPVPTIEEQNEVADILQMWANSINQIVKAISAKVQNKQALTQQLLTGKKRLPGFTAKWQPYHLGDLFDERQETNSGDLELLAVTRERGIIPAAEVERKDSSSEDKSLYKKICPGDIGYNTMRMWQGVSALSSLTGIISPAYTVCVPRPIIDGQFAAYLFKYPPMVHKFWKHSQGLVDDTLNLKFHHFAQIKVELPEINEQKAVARILTMADTEIKLHERQLAALEKQKRGLMQKLLTGQIRVKV